MYLTNNLIDLTILNIFNITNDSIIKESSSFKNGFLKKTASKQNLKYNHFNDIELQNKFFNIELEIRSVSLVDIYKLRKSDSLDNKIFTSFTSSGDWKCLMTVMFLFFNHSNGYEGAMEQNLLSKIDTYSSIAS